MTSNTSARSTTGTLLQKAAIGVGLVFLVVGIAGFIPGLTSGDLHTAGHDSMAMLLGVFMVSVLHNLVHVLFGIAGLAAARTWAASRMYFIAGGAIYLVLSLYGLVVDQNSGANFVPVNGADNWLHLGLGVLMVAVGLVLGRSRSAMETATR
jgi:Domain of unknown function (DUF4383)